jgi:hypothetical protein
LAQRPRHQKTRYCCLGVACEVFREHGGNLSRKRCADAGIIIFGEFTSHLPAVVADWLGISGIDNRVPLIPANGKRFGKEEPTTLVHANDELMLSFPEIADIIEAGRIKNG